MSEDLLIERVVGVVKVQGDALKEDHEFLMKGDVFTQDAIDMWVEYKTEKEIQEIQLRPHPYEFSLYYDC